MYLCCDARTKARGLCGVAQASESVRTLDFEASNDTWHHKVPFLTGCSGAMVVEVAQRPEPPLFVRMEVISRPSTFYAVSRGVASPAGGLPVHGEGGGGGGRGGALSLSLSLSVWLRVSMPN